MTDLEKGVALFGSVGAALFGLVGFGLWSGKTLGIAYRNRFIARRRQEPALYWFSLAIFAALGLLTLAAVFSNLRSMQR